MAQDYARQAITVKYIAPSNTKGIRYSASCAAKRIVRSELVRAWSNDEQARYVAMQLAKQLKWYGRWFGGRTKSGDWVFVQVEGLAFTA